MKEIKDEKIRESILTTEGNIVIAADAGTGKTYMTVERIKCDVMKVDNYQTYAAITFTNKAAKELLVRLRGSQQGFIGTNDKFVLNEVIEPFAKDVFPKVKGKKIKTDYSATEKRDKGKDLLARFVKEGVIGTYTDSRQNFAFKLALYILKNSHAAKRYLTNRYFRIYVDEYQDSDKDMHNFFMYLNEKLRIPFFIVGDLKQSIYEWRGGYPDGFRNLLQTPQYTGFKLLHNFRSNQQIQNYASIFIDDIRGNYHKSFLNGEVQGCIYSGDSELVQYIDKWLTDKKKCAFLVYSNREAKEWADKLVGLQFVQIPRAPIDEPELDNEQVWVARCVANYFYKKRYSEYSFYDEIPNPDAYDIIFIKNTLRTLKAEYYKNGWTDFTTRCVEKLYRYILEFYDEDKMKYEIQKLRETIEDTQYEKSFNIELYERIVTTIHSSKGLQYSQVIINSENFIYNNKLSKLQLHYVAITRPEERLLVLFKQNRKNAEVYYRAINEKVKNIVVEDIQQKVQDVIEMVKV